MGSVRQSPVARQPGLCSPERKLSRFEDNQPHRLAAWSAEELAKMPTYYIMDLADDMPTAVAKEMSSAAEIAARSWCCRSIPELEASS
jgi:hypothetical protein